MARHGSTKMTDIYSRSRIHRHHELAGAVYEEITSAEKQEIRRISAEQKMAVGSEMTVSDNGLVAYGHSEVVGATGFEPATSWSQTRRATMLRYAPNDDSSSPMENFEPSSAEI
jgi:hypothetical protein